MVANIIIYPMNAWIPCSNVWNTAILLRSECGVAISLARKERWWRNFEMASIKRDIRKTPTIAAINLPLLFNVHVPKYRLRQLFPSLCVHLKPSMYLSLNHLIAPGKNRKWNKRTESRVLTLSQPAVALHYHPHVTFAKRVAGIKYCVLCRCFHFLQCVHFAHDARSIHASHFSYGRNAMVVIYAASSQWDGLEGCWLYLRSDIRSSTLPLPKEFGIRTRTVRRYKTVLYAYSTY